jgi:hypothetical protein
MLPFPRRRRAAKSGRPDIVAAHAVPATGCTLKSAPRRMTLGPGERRADIKPAAPDVLPYRRCFEPVAAMNADAPRGSRGASMGC